MTNMTANGIECFTCGYVGITSSAYIEECPNDDDLNDPHWTVSVQIAACPNDVTASDWRRGDVSKCDSEQHQFNSGNHISQVADTSG